jgi:hypothetical protein
MTKRGIGGRVAMEVAAGGVLEGLTGMGGWVGGYREGATSACTFHESLDT